MGRLYCVEAIVGARFQAKGTGPMDRFAALDGTHESTDQAVAAGLDVAASWVPDWDGGGILEIVVGRILGSAGLDLAPTLSEVDPSIVSGVVEEVTPHLAALGHTRVRLYLVANHSD